MKFNLKFSLYNVLFATDNLTKIKNENNNEDCLCDFISSFQWIEIHSFLVSSLMNTGQDKVVVIRTVFETA